MIPSNISNGNESRHSSILKPCKPRQPLQNVNFNSPTNENTPATSKVKRRVSFAEKKHVKEFCHSTEQGTLWDNTYEEHDSGLKGSPMIDQNGEIEPKDSASEYVTEIGCAYSAVENSNNTNDTNMTNHQPMKTLGNENNGNCNLDLTKPIEYIELSDEGSLVEQSMLLNTSKNTLSNIVIYRDEEDRASTIGNNITSKLDKMCTQDLSMEFTKPISVPSVSSHVNTKGSKPKDVQEDDNLLHQNNFSIEYSANCNDMSMEITQIVPACIKAIESNLEMSEQISVIQNCENAKCNDTDNTYNNTTILSINSQVPQSIINEQTSNENSGDDSMELTTMVHSLVTDTSTCSTNNNENNTVSNSSMKVTNMLSNIEQENIMYSYDGNAGNSLRIDRRISENSNETEFYNNVSMEMTTPINVTIVYNEEKFRVDEPLFNHDKRIFVHDACVEMTKTMPPRDGQEIINSSTCKSFKENINEGKDIEKSTFSDERNKVLHKSMDCPEDPLILLYQKRELNTVSAVQSVDVALSQTTSKMYLSTEDPVESLLKNKIELNDNKTKYKISMEMTAAMALGSTQEIIDSSICKSFKENREKEKHIKQSISSNERTKLLHKSMDFTEVVSSYQEDVPNTMHTIQSTEPLLPQTILRSQLPLKNYTESLSQIDVSVNDNKPNHDISMEITAAVSSGSTKEIINPSTCKSLSKENTGKEKHIKQSISSNERTELLHKSMDFIEVVSSYQKDVPNTMHTMQSTEMLLPQTILRSQLPSKNYRESLSQIDASANDNKPNHNISMEITAAVSSGNTQEIINPSTCKSLSEENTGKEKHIKQSISSNERTELLHKSMGFTEIVSSYQEDVPNTVHTIQSTEMLLPQTMLRTQLPSKNYRESLLQIDASANDNKPNYNISMEITAAVSSGNTQEIVNPSTCKLLSEENTGKEKHIKQSISSNERTELLHKSMGFTETVSSYQEDVPNTVHTIQSTEMLLPQTILRSQLPSKNYRESLSQIDASANDNKPNHNISMEITAAVSSGNTQEISNPSTCKLLSKENKEKDMVESMSSNDRTDLLSKYMHNNIAINNNKTIHDISMEMITAEPSIWHFTQDTAINKTENLITSKSNDSQHFKTTDITQFKSLTGSGNSIRKEDTQITKEIAEPTNVHDELLNNQITSTDNLDHLSTALRNITDRKRRSYENEDISPKRIRSSLESQYSKENDTQSSRKVDNNYTNNDTCDKLLAENIVNPMHTLTVASSPKNLNKTDDCILNETNDYSFLRENLPFLQNNPTELESINPPSFVCMNSEEENFFLDIQHTDEHKSSMIIDATSSNSKNSSDRLTNIKYDQTKDFHKDSVMDKTGDYLEATCQTIVKAINNDNESNKSSCYETDAEKTNEKTVTISNSRFIKTDLISDDKINKKEHAQKKINDNTEPCNTEEKDRYSDIQELKTEKKETLRCIDYLKDSKTITFENQMDQKEYCRKNLNSEMKIQEQECVNIKDKSEMEQCITEDEPVVEQDLFLALSQKLEIYAASDDCIWNVCHKNIDRKMIVFGFISSSLLIVTFLSDNLNNSEKNLIKQIKISSRLSDDADVLIKIVHGLIMEKINVELLMQSYKTHEDLLSMLDFISQDVKLAMDFMFDLKRLDDLNLMEINRDDISFVSRSKRMDIILKVVVNVKRFDKLTPNDISVQCLLGTIKEVDVKNLIKGVKKDHKFLQRYMKDVKDYIDIMEDASRSSNNRR